MRQYVVLFKSDDADVFRKRVDTLCQVSGLPRNLVHEKVDTTNGQTFAIYVDEKTAKKYPQFESEFNGGSWVEEP